jgi:hypothetical protein
VRARVAALLSLPLLAAACGGSSGTPAGDTIAGLGGSGQEIGLVNGTADLGPGPVRYSFLMLDSHGRPIVHPTLRIWIARAKNGVSIDRSVPFLETSARLEDVGPPSDGAQHTLYVVHTRIDKPGKFWVLARPPGSGDVHGVGDFIVQPHSVSPPVGSRAPQSETPILGTAPIRLLTTRVPPDRGLLRYSVAGSLRAHKPFVVTFATPAFCTSRICGPVVDVVDQVRRELGNRGVRFIHVEIYKDNNPSKGFNQWVKQWHLPTEPWTFLVGRDGRIKAKFEGAVSAAELRAAVKRYLAA